MHLLLRSVTSDEWLVVRREGAVTERGEASIGGLDRVKTVL